MKTIQQRLLFWGPRVLCLLFAGFVSLFAMDALSEGHGFWGSLQSLAVHLIPTGIILLTLAVAWRWEWVGAAAFCSLGGLDLLTTWGRFHWSAYACISGPLFLVGILFFIGWVWRQTPRGVLKSD